MLKLNNHLKHRENVDTSMGFEIPICPVQGLECDDSIPGSFLVLFSKYSKMKALRLCQGVQYIYLIRKGYLLIW